MSANNSNGLTTRIVSGTSDTLTFQDDVVIFTNTAAKSAAISGTGDARLQKGKVYRFSNQNTGAITITPSAGTIDGAATQTVAAGAAGAPVTRDIVFDGTNWYST